MIGALAPLSYLLLLYSSKTFFFVSNGFCLSPTLLRITDKETARWPVAVVQLVEDCNSFCCWKWIFECSLGFSSLPSGFSRAFFYSMSVPRTKNVFRKKIFFKFFFSEKKIFGAKFQIFLRLFFWRRDIQHNGTRRGNKSRHWCTEWHSKIVNVWLINK
jgi:hypothetical protein